MIKDYSRCLNQQQSVWFLDKFFQFLDRGTIKLWLGKLKFQLNSKRQKQELKHEEYHKTYQSRCRNGFSCYNKSSIYNPPFQRHMHFTINLWICFNTGQEKRRKIHKQDLETPCRFNTLIILLLITILLRLLNLNIVFWG